MIPRAMPPSKRIMSDPTKWEFSADFQDGFERHTFPPGEAIPALLGLEEFQAFGHLKPELSNMIPCNYHQRKSCIGLLRPSTSRNIVVIHQVITTGRCSLKILQIVKRQFPNIHTQGALIPGLPIPL